MLTALIPVSCTAGLIWLVVTTASELGVSIVGADTAANVNVVLNSNANMSENLVSVFIRISFLVWFKTRDPKIALA